MQLNELKTQLKAYRSTLSEIIQHRKEWQAAETLIYTTLTKVVKELDINALVEKEEKWGGLGHVCFKFGSRESGIFERAGGAKHALMKEGGCLHYTQLYNGSISVWLSMPTIENLTEPQTLKPIEIYQPKELKEGAIIGHLTGFLRTMINWERQNLAHHGMVVNFLAKK